MEQTISIKYAKAILSIHPNWRGTIEGDLENELVINWDGKEEISVADIQAKITEMETAEADAITAKANLKASAKTKLMAGEALTEDEASMLVI
tara:strand:+ start:569 stop:847 length:279 start_codon:yes stop_codon:yes gene_type:complete